MVDASDGGAARRRVDGGNVGSPVAFKETAMRCLPLLACLLGLSCVAAIARGETPAMHHATGTFEVKLQPQPAREDAGLARMSLDKVFAGPLSATSRGEMLAARTAQEGSAVYVAIESVEGTLDGRQGGFMLAHRSVMDRGAPAQAISVVPDSGTGALAGLRGEMKIRIEGGAHYYDFDYTLPAD